MNELSEQLKKFVEDSNWIFAKMGGGSGQL
jgi:hypothetical protein